MGLPLLERHKAAAREAAARGDRKAYDAARAAYDHTKASTAARQKAYATSDDKEYDANSGTSGARQLVEGIGGGMQNVGLRVGRILQPGDTPGLTKQIDEQTHLDEQMSGKHKFGKFVGEVIATAPIGGGAGAGVKALTAAGRAGQAGRMLKLAANAAEGAVGGEATTDNGAGTGALMGAAALPILRILGKTGKALGMGVKRSKDADVLLQHDAKLDLGQMKPGGWVDRAIKAAESAPLGVGAAIRGAREANLRPVVPNMAADMAGMARPTGSLSARQGIDDALTHVENKFNVVNEVGLDSGTAGQLARGRLGAADAGYAGRQTGRDSVAEAGAALDDASKMAKSNVLMSRAARRKRAADPDVREARRLQEEVRNSRLGTAENKADEFAPSRATYNEPAHKAIENYRSDLQKDLLHAARTRFLPRRERRLVERELGEQLEQLQDKTLDPSKLKKMASTLKTKAREYKETGNPTEETRRLSRAYNSAAQMLERRIERALQQGGKDVDVYVEANKQFGKLQPLQSAVVETGATAHGLINPRMLEKALQKQIGDRAWTAGKGGAPRQVTEALKRLELSAFEGGALQTSGIPSQLIRAMQGLAGVPLSSKFAASIGRGDHLLGKTLRNASPRTKRLVRAIAALHHGVPGALVED